MDEDSLVNDTVDDDLRKNHKNPSKGASKRSLRRKAKKNAKKNNKSARGKIKNLLYKKVGLAALGGLPFFIILFMIIGIISFITTMPGMVQEGILKEFLGPLADSDSLKYALTGSDYYLETLAQDENRTSQKKVLKYLDDMGLDPVGFGFVATYTRNGDDVEYSPSLFDNEPKLEDYGDHWNLISQYLDAKEYNDAQVQYIKDNDILFNYIVSNERAYLVHDEDKVGNAVKGMLGYKGFTGMIETRIENDHKIFTLPEWSGEIGKRVAEAANNAVAYTGITDWDDSTITVDREARQMIISSLNTSLKEFTTVKQEARYDLDSYTSRYGMPLEFLLALHIGTMSPDLTTEIVKNENLQTVVRLIALKEEYDTDYEITYTSDDGIKRELPIPYGKKYSRKLIDYNLTEDKVKYDKEKNEFSFDFSEDDINHLKEVISISALHNWIENIKSFDLKPEVNEPFIIDSTNIAKDAFLGDGMYRVLYRIQANCYDTMPNWRMTAWFGSVNNIDDENNEWRYTSEPEKPDDATLYLFGDVNGTIQVTSTTTRYLKEYLLEGTDTIYINGLNEKPILVNPNVEVRDRDPDNLISEGEYYSPYEDAVYTTGILHGIEYYLNGHAGEIRDNEYVKIGITCILSQLDSYLYRNKLAEFTDYKFNKVDPDKYFNVFGHDLIRSDWFRSDDYKDLELLLTQDWLDFWEANSSPSDEQIYSELQKLRDMTNDCFGFIGDNKDSYIEKLINQLFEELDLDLELTIEDINIIYDALFNALDSYEYITPRIAYVVRHWYKDIIFEIPGDDSVESAYRTTDKEIRLPYKLPEEGENDRLEVTAVLNVEGGEHHKDNVYEQWRQPYVVKGDVVYLDGEKQEGTGLENGKKTVETDAGKYTIGDGYRTMKKLMTQGQYYVLDGSRPTAKSVLWCKKLENISGNLTVRVKSGRILSIGNTPSSYDEVDQETAIANVLGNAYSASVSEPTVVQDYNDSDTGEVIYEYTVSKTVTPYISVGNKFEGYSDEEVLEASKKSVETINKMLEELGVKSKRVPVSFDNTTLNGDVVTLTAFGLLEGMHTEPAQYIYRDFKEMLIEFGYYTKAEFDSLNKNVLQWFLPEYVVNTQAEASNWRQNKEEDSLDYGAIIYPVDESEFIKGNDGSKKKKKKADEEATEKDILGIKAGMEVVAPGNCTIESKDGAVVLTFDGISQPEIGVVDRYQMIIEGITLSKTGTATAGETIGSTTGERVKVILKNNIGGYVDNIEDYMQPSLNFGNIVMVDMEEEEVIELIWQFEGTSDADPNDGDYYTVEYPAGDVPTVGHGVTAATEATWHELGYSEYISNGRFIKNKIPKEVVDNVSRVETEKNLQYLDDLLDANGVVWGGNQRAAWVSLYYNGWHAKVESIVEDWGNGEYRSARDKWLSCWMAGFEQGHKNRRAQEWVLFCTGELWSQGDAYNACYITKEY